MLCSLAQRGLELGHASATLGRGGDITTANCEKGFDPWKGVSEGTWETFDVLGERAKERDDRSGLKCSDLVWHISGVRSLKNVGHEGGIVASDGLFKDLRVRGHGFTIGVC